MYILQGGLDNLQWVAPEWPQRRGANVGHTVPCGGSVLNPRAHGPYSRTDLFALWLFAGELWPGFWHPPLGCWQRPGHGSSRAQATRHAPCHGLRLCAQLDGALYGGHAAQKADPATASQDKTFATAVLRACPRQRMVMNGHRFEEAYENLTENK